jgi:trehalose 6-phosphate synthase
VHLRVGEDHALTLAAYARYDVLAVTSVRDGMNLVAREGPVLNRRDGVVVLSTGAGAAAEIGHAALRVRPRDLAAASAAMERAVEMGAAERARRAALLRSAAPGTRPAAWLDAQLREVRRAGGPWRPPRLQSDRRVPEPVASARS